MSKAPVQYRGSNISVDSTDGVERPGPGQAPTAFRIWRAGANVCKWVGSEPETFFFTKKSVELLAAAQAESGLLYMFDLDHRSLKPRTKEDGDAVGWHRLEFRPDKDGNAECWAAGCEWEPEVKAGIESKPPKRRYFSPVWNVDPDTNEIVSYVNCALTNSPATLNIPSLAAAMRGRKADTTKGKSIMDKQTALDALADVAKEPLTDAQKAAVELLVSFVESLKEESEEKSEGSSDSPEENKGSDDENKGSADEDEDAKKATADNGKEPTVTSLQAQIDDLRKEALLTKAGITGPKAAALMAKPIDVVREAINLSAGMAPRGERPVVPQRNESQSETNPALAMIDSIGDRALAQIKKSTGKAGE
ncbi:MAG: hypothetical protein KF764_03025 [Labilithrix sp.]|nr:hypothetical protein [Labilithrix sp.]